MSVILNELLNRYPSLCECKEDIEKAKWIKCIIECMNDVPLRRVKHIFEQKNIEFDSDDFLEENDF